MSSKVKLIFSICIIIVIILLLLFGCSRWNNLEENTSTEKVNVFDINVNVNYIQYILDENGNIIGKQEGTEPFLNGQSGEATSGEKVQSDSSGEVSSGEKTQSNGSEENAGSTSAQQSTTSGEGSQNDQNTPTSGDSSQNGDFEENGTLEANLSGENTNNGDNGTVLVPSGDKQVRDKNGYEIPIYNPNKDKNLTGKVFVDDKNGDFMYQESLDIFHDSMYNNRQLIAPGSNNTYQFVVHNSSNQNASYRIEMEDESEYPINMKYRLKKEDQYVIGGANEWVSAKEIKTQYNSLLKGKDDKYYLDWKWFDDDENDTIAGSNMTSAYQLTIKVFFNIDEK